MGYSKLGESMIVAFCGPSSSGKSTLRKEVKKIAFFLNKRVVVKKEDNFITISFVKHIFGNKLFSDYKRAKFFEKKPTTKLKIFSFLVNFSYPLLVYIEFLWEYLYYEVIRKEKVLIRDRYIYDYLITFQDILKIRNNFVNIFYRTFPRPSLLFYVSVDKETLLKRNKNNIPGKITARESFQADVLRSYTSLVREKNILTIDNSGSLKKSIREVELHVMARVALLKTRSIAIIGLDGAGKTMLAKKVQSYADQLNISCRVVHFYHDNILFKLLKLLGFFRDENYNIPKNFVRRKKTTLWAILTWIDSYLQYLFVMTLYRKSLIIFDRYFYDYLVTFNYHKITKGMSIFKSTIPSPGYAVFLACQPEIAFKRKPENMLVFFVRGASQYHQLVRQYGIKTIDASSNTSSGVVFNKLIAGIIDG